MDSHITERSAVSTTPARARTDVTAGEPREAAEPIAPRTVRGLGLVLATGTLSWAAATFAFPTVTEGTPARIFDLTGLAFQIGLFALLTVQIRTLAAGTSRVSRIMLKVEVVLLALAAVSSLLYGVLPASLHENPALMFLDLFWPLSMLGMMIIGIKLAFAGRWRGALRWWPLIAESWVGVTIPAMIIFGDAASRWFGGGHLLIGYAALGLLLALRPHLVLPRD